jgi:hypothetical protein
MLCSKHCWLVFSYQLYNLLIRSFYFVPYACARLYHVVVCVYSNRHESYMTVAWLFIPVHCCIAQNFLRCLAKQAQHVIHLQCQNVVVMMSTRMRWCKLIFPGHMNEQINVMPLNVYR